MLTGNKIGTNTAGNAAVPNEDGSGIMFCDTSDSTIGGTTASERNIISGNTGQGIDLVCDSRENIIRGNYIGREVDGTTNIPNDYAGIQLETGDRNVIGGTGSGAGSLIAGNAGPGIAVSSAAQGTAIWGNSITDNGGLGIDLNYDSAVNANDTGDADDGGNHLQNFPVLTQAASDGTVTRVQGSLNSRPDHDYRLEFFANDAATPPAMAKASGTWAPPRS